MKKYTFWSMIHQNKNIALTEDLSRYSTGETFWQAMQHLCETLQEWTPSADAEESDINSRLKMFYETGVNKAEIFIEEEGGRYAIKCANTRSLIKADAEREALMKYIETKAKTSLVNTGEPVKA